MKRPLAVIGLSGLIAQCLAMWMNSTFSLFFGVFLLAVALLLVICRFPDKAWRTAVLSAGAVMLLTGGLERILVDPVRALDGKTSAVYGTLLEQNGSETSHYITVQADRVVSEADADPLGADLRLRIYLSEPLTADPYDMLELHNVRLTAPSDGFGLSARGYYESLGIYLTGSMSIYDAKVTAADSRPWYAFLSDWTASLKRALRTMLPEHLSALIGAMLLGDRQSLPETVTTAFRRCGMSAMLVVSGMHLSYLIGSLLMLLRRVLSYRAAAAICIPVTVLFLALTGFTGSGIRAGVSMLIYLVAIILMRDADPLNSLGAAAIVLLLIRPFSGGNIGVQLSFAATGGILLWAEPMCESIMARLPKRMQKRAVRTAFTLLSVSAAAIAATAMLTVLAFGELPLSGLWMNALFAVPAQVLLVSGAVAAGTGALGLDIVARPAAWIAGMTARLFEWGTAWGSRVPVLNDTDGLLTGWVSLTLVTAGILIALNASRRWKRAAAILCALLLIPVAVSGQNRSATEITVLRCGDGLAVCVDADGECALFLQGNTNALYTNTVSFFDGHAKADRIFLPDETYRLQPARTAAALIRWGKANAIVCAETFRSDELERVGAALNRLETVEESPLDNMTVEQYAGASGGWYRIQTGACRILIAYGTADAADLPLNCRYATYLIMAEPPVDVVTIHADTVLLSCSARSEARCLNRLGNTYGVFYTTAENGSIRAKNGSVCTVTQ